MKRTIVILLLGCVGFGCTSNMRLVSKRHSDSSSRGEAPLSVHVYREFRRPGHYPWTNGMTLKDGIALAGGFTDYAGRTLILRHWNGSEEHYKLGRRKSISINPELSPGDQVISPSDAP